MKDAVFLRVIYWLTRVVGFLAVRLDHPANLPAFKPTTPDPADMPKDDIYGCTCGEAGRDVQTN